MRIVAISDSHMQHEQIEMPPGDILIHCGDALNHGTIEELTVFAQWFTAQPFDLKLYVPGNHDRCLETHRALTEDIMVGAEILIDRAYRYEGLLFYGTPWTRRFMNLAFMEDEPKLARYYDLMPEKNLDVLITHGSSHGTLDGLPVTIIGHPGASVTECLGSTALSDRVMKVKPRVHVHGHIHSGYSLIDNGTTRFYNAAICSDAYEPVNKPHVIELEAICHDKQSKP